VSELPVVFSRMATEQLMHPCSPYTRETYRYTPLLAVLVTPNEWLHPSFGKYLFAACDLLAGVLLRQLLVHLVLPAARQDEAEDAHPSGSSGESKVSPVGVDPAFLERWASLLAAVHLLNPMVFAISTRGSSEAILLLLVLLALGASMRGHWTTAAVWLGVAAHWKIYPAVYGVACVGVIGAEQGLVGIRRFVNGRAIRFTVVSAGTFFALGAACYAV
jgi:phosphatidylinositol glycan class M